MVNPRTNRDLPLISVIVPVYKVEKYLLECVDSICTQTYTNLEIWLIDDGSPDTCGVICDAYAKTDNRIRVIHKQNGGLSDARNAALNVCTGEFLLFVDSDDYIGERHIEILYFALTENNAGISITNDTRIDNNGGVIEKSDKKKETCKALCFDRETSFCEALYRKHFKHGAWAKLYRAELWRDQRFSLNRFCEDLQLIPRILYSAHKTVFVDTGSYYYRMNHQSLGHTIHPKMVQDTVWASKSVCAFALDLGTDCIQAAEYESLRNALGIIENFPKNVPGVDSCLAYVKEHRKNVLLNPAASIWVKGKIILTYAGFSFYWMITRFWKLWNRIENEPR